MPSQLNMEASSEPKDGPYSPRSLSSGYDSESICSTGDGSEYTTVSESGDSDAFAFDAASLEMPTTHPTYVAPHLGYKKVLVTGGAGFIGSSVAMKLLERGDDVVIVDEVNDYYDVRIKRNNLKMLLDAYGPDRCKIYEGDMCDVPFITNVYETEKPEWVVHMAARAGVRPSIDDPFIYVHSNVEATTRLLELSRVYGCKSFAFASSSSVYGGSMAELFSETDVVDFPVSPYAATKKACELLAHTYYHLYGMNIAGLRFFTVYGPRGRPDMAPFKFINNVCMGKQIQQYGDGSTSRDYTYIDDIVDGVIRSLDRPAGYQIYNLGMGSPTQLSRFIELVEENVGKPAKIVVCPEQPGDVPRTCANVTKARNMLGYNPTTPFEEGIKKTVEWFKNDYFKGSVNGEENPEQAPMTRCASMVRVNSSAENCVRRISDCSIINHSTNSSSKEVDAVAQKLASVSVTSSNTSTSATSCM